MSLLVYSKGALYSDRRYILTEGTMTQRSVLGQKLYYNTGKTATVALIGQDPGFDNKDFQLIIDVVCARVESCSDKGADINISDEKLLKRIFSGDDTHYLVLTKTAAVVVKKDLVMRLPEEEDFAVGTGDVCFMVARHHGLSVEESYERAGRIVKTMGGPVDKISREDLCTPVVFTAADLQPPPEVEVTNSQGKGKPDESA